MSKLKFAALLLGLLVSVPQADAQGFLKKAKEKMEKAKEQVEKVNKSVQNAKETINGNSTNSSTSTGTSNSTSNIGSSHESADQPNEEVNNSRSGLVRGNIVRDRKKSLKTTPATIKLESTSDHYALGDFHDGMALVALNGQYPYFINKKGEKLNLDFELKDLENKSDQMLPRFDNGRVLLKKDNDVVIVDKNGKILKTFTGDIVSYYGFENGIGLILYKKNLNYTPEWIDTDGNKIYAALDGPTRSDLLLHNPPRSVSEGLRAYNKYEADKYKESWGFIDNTGKWAVQPEYFAVRDFHDGLAAVQCEGRNEDSRKWGFVDKSGKLVIDCKFSNEPSDFNNGYAIVKNRNGQQVVIDKSGNSVMTMEDEWTISPFMNGYAILEGYEENGMGGYEHVSYAVTDGGKQKVAYQIGDHFEAIGFDPTTGKTYYKYGQGYGLLDVPNMTSKAEGLRGVFSDDGLAVVDDGYVNENGEYVIKVVMSEF